MAWFPTGLLLLCLASYAYSYGDVRTFSQFFFQELVRDDTKNVVYSPLGVSTGLAMLLQAAGGDTAAQLEKVLGLDAEQAKLRYGALTYYMNSFAASATSDTFMATKIFLREGISVTPQFSWLLEDRFLSSVSHIDFGNGGAGDAINQWFSDLTNGLIPALLDREPSKFTFMFLANAVYFKGIWQHQFSLGNTETFYTKPDQEVSVPFMSTTLTTYGGRCSKLNVTWVILPFQDRNLRMVLMMPFESSGMERVIREKTTDIWNTISTNSSMGLWHVEMPRFTLEGTQDLKIPLQCLGARDVFDAEKSNLTGMSSFYPLAVSRYVHKAVLEVSEEGARPPVNSGAGTLEGEFIANEPFLVTIMDWKTHVPLITSLVRDPSEVPSTY